MVAGGASAATVAGAVWADADGQPAGEDTGAIVVGVDTDLRAALPWLEQGVGPVLLVSAFEGLPVSPGRVLVPVVSSGTSAAAIEVAARLALTSRADLVLVHLRRPGGSVASVERAADWALTLGVTTDTLIREAAGVGDDALADLLHEVSGPTDVIVTGTTVHLGVGHLELGGCAERLFRARTPMVAVVPAASGPFSPPAWA